MQALACAINVLVLIVGLFYLRRRGNLRLLVNVFLCWLIVSIFYLSTITSGSSLENTTLLWVVIVPLTSGFFNKVVDTIVVSVAIILGILGIWVWEGALGTYSKYLLDLTGVVCTSAIFTVVFRHILDVALELVAKQNNQVRNLLRVVLHDLANPLSIASMAVNMLDDERASSTPELRKKMLTKAKNALERLQLIIEEVSVYEASDSGKRVVHLQTISLISNIEAVVHDFKDKLEAKGLKIEINNECTDEAWVQSEERPLKFHILSNLLTNAIKFSHKNSKILITIGETPETYFFTVQDFGIGMSRELIDTIFDMDTPTHRAGTEGESGTGFGMPIVKSYVDRFGGQIRVVSEEGKGSQFEVQLIKAKP